MRDASKPERDLARRLILQESRGEQSSLALVAATDQTFDRLFRHLSTLIGTDGFDALAKRALHLAAIDFPILQGVSTRVEADTFRYQGLTACTYGRGQDEVEDGLEALLGYFFWLLIMFVGANLFDRLMRGVWTNLQIEDSGSRSEGGLE
jgi:hypothetical protein